MQQNGTVWNLEIMEVAELSQILITFHRFTISCCSFIRSYFIVYEGTKYCRIKRAFNWKPLYQSVQNLACNFDRVSSTLP